MKKVRAAERAVKSSSACCNGKTKGFCISKRVNLADQLYSISFNRVVDFLTYEQRAQPFLDETDYDVFLKQTLRL
ncbi:hypothetical protein PALU110988_19155 [Paenibacillus lupini]|nr:hypothetical protein [Paenibacillus lupini]